MARQTKLLPRDFYERDAVVVAQELLGMHLRRNSVVLRITETEAYCWPDDSACHNRFGRTERNAPMWGPGGHAYVYLCYGLHQMLNVVTNPPGEAAAVLIRACEPVSGLSLVRQRRKGIRGPALLTGPGKVGAALGINTKWSGHALYERGGLEILQGEPPRLIVSGPRVGIEYASPLHRAAAWRFASGESEWVTYRSTLSPPDE